MESTLEHTVDHKSDNRPCPGPQPLSKDAPGRPPDADSAHSHTNVLFFLLLGADVINFDGHVVLPYRFRNKKMKTLKDVIALKFKTSESEGVILHGEGQQGDYITLELKKAKLVLSLNL
ncbi:Hypothetical predicted protein, partial [Marmota monax]